MASKQKVYVDSLPEDSVQIKNYNGKEYANLFFSPSNKKFYQAPAMKFKELKFNERGYARPTANDGTSGTISITSIERHFNDQIGENKV